MEHKFHYAFVIGGRNVGALHDERRFLEGNLIMYRPFHTCTSHQENYGVTGATSTMNTKFDCVALLLQEEILRFEGLCLA